MVLVVCLFRGYVITWPNLIEILHYKSTRIFQSKGEMVAAIITYAHDKRRFNLTKTNLEYDGYDGTFLDLYKHNDLTQLTAPEIVKEFFHDTGKCSNHLSQIFEPNVAT